MDIRRADRIIGSSFLFSPDISDLPRSKSSGVSGDSFLKSILGGIKMEDEIRCEAELERLGQLLEDEVGLAIEEYAELVMN